MKKEVMEKWVKALRSGDYKQGKGALHSEGKFCCLGVLCELSPIEGKIRKYDNTYIYDGRYGVLPGSVLEWSGVTCSNGETRGHGNNDTSLIHLNDTGNTFEQIADLIENNWEDM